MMSITNKDIVVIDLETSGINPFENDLLAIGVVPLDSSVPDKLIYVRQDNIKWSKYAKDNFQKFSSEWSALAIPPREACDQIEKYIRNEFNRRTVTPVGHNIGFDVSFLRKLAFLGGRDQLAGISHRAIDTHTLLYALVLKGKIPEWANTSDGAFKYFDIHIEDRDRHTALGDAYATKELFLKAMDLL